MGMEKHQAQDSEGGAIEYVKHSEEIKHLPSQGPSSTNPLEDEAKSLGSPFINQNTKTARLP